MKTAKRIFVIIVILLIALLFFLLIYVVTYRPHVDKREQAVWLWQEVQILQNRGAPSESVITNMAAKYWANNGLLVFSNGWAFFAYTTFHDSETVGDMALLRTPDGMFYISHYHFCAGEQMFCSDARPGDFQQFLQIYRAKHGWTRGSVPTE